MSGHVVRPHMDYGMRVMVAHCPVCGNEFTGHDSRAAVSAVHTHMQWRHPLVPT